MVSLPTAATLEGGAVRRVFYMLTENSPHKNRYKLVDPKDKTVKEEHPKS